MIIKKGKSMEGQIYIPAINVLLMVCCVLLVIGFRTSESLASAYGVAVCGGIFFLLTIINYYSLLSFVYFYLLLLSFIIIVYYYYFLLLLFD